jgi:TetR/AcrR family transcriptional repressor of nem operon
MREGEQTRQEIIRRAAPLFNQKGYEGTALSDLMQATGLEKGGIYRHFDSKQELAGEALVCAVCSPKSGSMSVAIFHQLRWLSAGWRFR